MMMDVRGLILFHECFKKRITRIIKLRINKTMIINRPALEPLKDDIIIDRGNNEI